MSRKIIIISLVSVIIIGSLVYFLITKKHLRTEEITLPPLQTEAVQGTSTLTNTPTH